jgi:hypothetical protein
MCHFRNASPDDITMPHLRRYAIITDRHGQTAFDVYETMNRLEYFMGSGHFRVDAVLKNLETLSKIRAHELSPLDGSYFDPHFSEHVPVRYISPRGFWYNHGVKVGIRHFEEQEREFDFESAMVEAAIAVEDAHLLWNLYDDGAQDSTATDPITDEELSQLMNEPIQVEVDLTGPDPIPEIIDLTHE